MWFLIIGGALVILLGFVGLCSLILAGRADDRWDEMMRREQERLDRMREAGW